MPLDLRPVTAESAWIHGWPTISYPVDPWLLCFSILAVEQQAIRRRLQQTFLVNSYISFALYRERMSRFIFLVTCLFCGSTGFSPAPTALQGDLHRKLSKELETAVCAVVHGWSTKSYRRPLAVMLPALDFSAVVQASFRRPLRRRVTYLVNSDH